MQVIPLSGQKIHVRALEKYVVSKNEEGEKAGVLLLLFGMDEGGRKIVPLKTVKRKRKGQS